MDRRSCRRTCARQREGYGVKERVLTSVDLEIETPRGSFMSSKVEKYDAIYARYSSHQQDDSTSIEVQIEQCERAAGGNLVPYIDRARTGRTAGGRPELQRLIDDAERGMVRRLFVYK